MNDNVKSVLIFGGARGIGRVLAEAFIKDGFCVSIAARTGKQVDDAVKALSMKGAALGHRADVAAYDEVEWVLKRHLSQFGTVDIVVNTAAVQGPIGSLWVNEPADWARNIEINLVGSFNVCRSAVPKMIQAGNGVMILFSGGGAAYARPHFSAYGTGKTAVLRLAETLHQELEESEARDVRIYAVAPGDVKTAMTEEVLAQKDEAGTKACAEALKTKEKGGTPPEKAAELCLFLAKNRPKCLSGRLIHVNEPYREYVAQFEGKDIGDSGLLRRQGYRPG